MAFTSTAPSYFVGGASFPAIASPARSPNGAWFGIEYRQLLPVGCCHVSASAKLTVACTAPQMLIQHNWSVPTTLSCRLTPSEILRVLHPGVELDLVRDRQLSGLARAFDRRLSYTGTQLPCPTSPAVPRHAYLHHGCNTFGPKWIPQALCRRHDPSPRIARRRRSTQRDAI